MNVMLDAGAIMPVRKHSTDAGLDLYSKETVTIPRLGHYVFHTGFHADIPAGYAGFVKGRSSLNALGVLAPEGTIDAGYTGDIGVALYNLTQAPYTVKRGDRIAQLVITPVELPELVQVDSLQETERGNGGFGSTGR